MLNFKYASSKSQKHLTKMSLFIINFILLSTLIPISIHAAPGNDPNVVNVIEFNHKKFKAGNFATNKNGDLFIEYYSEAAEDTPVSRLFYGRTKEGREIFFNESSYTQEIGIGLDETIDISEHLNYFKIYNSKHLFITIKNDTNKENQYLFSINPYEWSVELHKFNNNINSAHYLWNFNDFFNLDRKKYRFPYETFLFELKADSSYIIVFLPKMDINENMNELSFAKKFKFKSFSEDAYEEITSIKFENYINKRILSVFMMDDTFLVVISWEEIEEEEVALEIQKKEADELRLRNLQNSFQIKLNFYYDDLDYFEVGNNNILAITNFYYEPSQDLFFKTFYLKNGFAIITWILPYEYVLLFSLYKLSYTSGGNSIGRIYPFLIELTYDEILSDFVKINDKQIIFICTNAYLEEIGGGIRASRRNEEMESSILNILIIDIQPDYKGISNIVLKQAIIYNYEPTLQISGFFYNNFLLFTSTAIPIEENNIDEDNLNYLSIFMIFGYPNGTDNIIDDISPFLYFEGEPSIEGESLYDYLVGNYHIENNIFEYQRVDRIRLTSIPNELKIVPITDENNEGNQLQNNSYLNEGIIYRIKQNKNLVKTSQYYYIDYQYIVKENEESADVKEFQTKRRLASEESKYYYGRINRLKFKLCHKYCEKCYELSVLDEAQKCTSCLPENQYNYLTFTNDNDYQENEINCVPEGFYFVRDRNVLASCKEPNNNYYYINIIDNKNICFDKNYGCPEEFPILDDETKECFNCDLTHYTNNKCTMAQFKEKSCTECNFDCYTLEACNFDEFDTTNDDFYDSIKSGGFISKYDGEHGDLKISNGDGYTFQITTVENELNGLKDNSQSEFSIIDLKECAELLKRENGLDPDVDLVILKYENTDSVSNGNEKSI